MVPMYSDILTQLLLIDPPRVNKPNVTTKLVVYSLKQKQEKQTYFSLLTKKASVLSS